MKEDFVRDPGLQYWDGEPDSQIPIGPKQPPAGLRQWFTAKTLVAALDAVFQQVADADGRVEKVHHTGGRDWIIFWSKPVVR
jgi:hypothetical protein